jgi:uncharacterized protein YjbI with pentapeptide repeats
LWAVGTLLALVTIALLVELLVVNLEAVKWEDLLSRERIEQGALFIGIAVALTTLFVLLAIGGASLGWTGFGDKTFWDWLQLLSALAIPVVLAAAGLWFTAQQDARQQKIEDRRADQAQRIENQRAESEQEIEEQRTQDAALQAYLDEMSSLMIGKNSLRDSEEDSEVRTLARARTLTALGRLDPSRKTAVMEFLVEAELVQKIEGREPIISLNGAALSGVNLDNADLSGAALFEADLSGANLNNAVLSGADLSGASLSEAALREASLRKANLSNATLSGDGCEAHLSDGERRAFNLYGADLREANLSGANLSEAYLCGARLNGVMPWLSLQNLTNLSYADLRAAQGVTKEGLEDLAQTFPRTAILEGTIMPDGSVSGRYAPREFEPPLSLSLSDGWQIAVTETPGPLSGPLFIEGPEGGALKFNRPLHVFDLTNPSELKKRRAPENTDEWVSRFQRHPNLDTSKPVPVSVGGASGMRIDVTDCGQPCLPLYTIRGGRERLGT